MAKKSAIERNNKRKALVKKYAGRRGATCHHSQSHAMPARNFVDDSRDEQVLK